MQFRRIALASLKAEPVAIVEPSDFVTAAQLVGEEPRSKAVRQLFEGALAIGQKLYAAPPVLVSVPDKITSDNAPEVFEIAAEAERLGLRGAYASYAVGWNACRAAMLQVAAGNSPVIQDWHTEAKGLAELHGISFIVFQNGESPQCDDPSKVIISFTGEVLGNSAATPQQDVK